MMLSSGKTGVKAGGRIKDDEVADRCVRFGGIACRGIRCFCRGT